MIAAAGYYRLCKGDSDDLTLEARSTWPIARAVP